MDKEFNCSFYFGDRVNSDIKKLNYQDLNGFKEELSNVSILNTSFSWQKGAWYKIFKNYKFFLITGEPYYLSNWALIILGKILGKKVIPWAHGIKGDYNKMEWFEKLFFKLCPLVLLYGNHSRNIMINKGFNPDKLICIYNSLNHDKQINLRNSIKPSQIYFEHFNNKNPTIIYIGRIQKSKKLELLAECIHRLNKKGINCNLVFIGKDLKDNNVVKTAKELEIEKHVWFYGPCYEEEKISELIFNANLCVSPGPVGLTALHSLTYGTPVISNDNFNTQMPEYEVIKPKKTGDFYQENNIEDLIIKIIPWLKINNTLRDEVRKDCYKVIDDNWNPKSQIITLKKIFVNAEN
ncbi:glycosyltransferase [Maribacter dokdonensis]|uniref:glycosyltransferase n=1 Tax=Maribacter dokdonensis TaxID=320912 RepID=UPI001C0A417C|nr:glycosyltransferase [Maribacter dokdonensis]MBU2901528.1 glycosyltransferase [Maribacter dokdonensis]